jgi:hypothetical protein
VGAIANSTSGINSALEGDTSGVTFSVFSFIPGPVGIISSGISFLQDITTGFYFVDYIPSQPR